MKCLAFVTQKGGAGKSTLAASLAVAAVEAGERPFLIDLDPQGSLLNWSQRRRADEPAVDRIGADQLAPALQGLAGNGYTLAIIDTQGIDSPAVAAAMRVSDLALIPSRPSALDIEASRPTLAALNRLQRPYAFILNQCPPSRSNRLADGASALNLLGVLANPFMVQRTDHQDALALGLGVTELEGSSKAADEVRELWRWVKRRLEVH